MSAETRTDGLGWRGCRRQGTASRAFRRLIYFQVTAPTILVMPKPLGRTAMRHQLLGLTLLGVLGLSSALAAEPASLAPAIADVGYPGAGVSGDPEPPTSSRLLAQEAVPELRGTTLPAPDSSAAPAATDYDAVCRTLVSAAVSNDLPLEFL